MSIKISQLPVASENTDSSVLPIVEGGETQQLTSLLLSYYISNRIKTNVTLEPTVGGNFTVPHGIGGVPSAAIIQMTSSGLIWFQNPSYDATNLYLVASDGPLTGNAIVFI